MRSFLTALLLFAVGPMAPAVAMDKIEAQAQFNAMVSNWYGSLKQPDYPKSSCCGDGDAYYADRVAECDPLRAKYGEDPGNCALVAIITDTRPDHFEVKRPDGSVTIIDRVHIPVGTRIPIPPNKLRRPPEPNPTDHNVVFINAYEGYWVLCWEPTSGM